MIQAYRRGLLRPDHPNGIRSRIREDILLESVDTELITSASDRRLEMIGKIIGAAPIASNYRSKLLNDLLVDLKYNDHIRIGDFDGGAQYRFENSSLAAASVYDLISQAGWVTGDNVPDEEHGPD